MNINGTEIEDTFAEAFSMWAARVIITGASARWAMIAAQSFTGFATSIIGCKCEAGIERELAPDETPDGRPGVGVLLFTTSRQGIASRLVERVGQCVLTCPTTACYNGLPEGDPVEVGANLRYFGDGYQISKVLGGRRYWRIPVMEGEFLVEEHFGAQPAVGGGNLLILGEDPAATLEATEAAVAAMRALPGVIAPFPGGITRSGSKTGSRYKFLFASTSHTFCPTLRGIVPETQVPEGVNCVLEIVIDGLTEAAVARAMAAGMRAAAGPGIRRITAGNYGGTLGQYQIRLHEVLG
jgi:formylmethanofuran--tetrahydromethanopterin N-formyltransferase